MDCNYLDLDLDFRNFLKEKLEWIPAHEFIDKCQVLKWFECEAIINPKGEVAFATYGHVEAMIEFSNESKESIYNKMDILEIPVLWLVNYTSCISVWEQGILCPKIITKEQQDALNILIENNLTTRKSFL